ncbi:MAG: type VI secretion system ATPase TssH, partial [Acetobacteraceae bacterium]|nr:type VI secretion system ATPase TssH [Acetobacteraceae bacterium]
MAAIDFKSLFGRLNDVCWRALDAAAALALSRTHYDVELEHWLVKLADRSDSDVALILRHYEVDVSRLVSDLNRRLDRFRRGSARDPGLAPEIVDLGKQAWLLASIEQGLTRIRSGHLLWALLADEDLARHAREISGQLLRIQPNLLKRDYEAITAGSVEAGSAVKSGESSAAPVPQESVPRLGGGALDQFTIDLTARAKAGKIDPILGRDLEIRQVVDILTRRRQNNPILTGEAG